MKSAHPSSTVAAWVGILLAVLGLALIGWILASLNELHARLSTMSPRFATLIVVGTSVVLLAILGVGFRILWTFRGADRRPSPDAAVASDPVGAAGQTIAAAQKQVALVADEVARRALSAELSQVAGDLAESRYTIVVFGTGSTGKTSLINALLGRPAGDTDPITGTTRQGDMYAYAADGFVEGCLRLVDTPGLSEIGAAGADREQRARELAAEADLLLFVVDQDLRDIEFKPLGALARLGKKLILVLNKRDLYSPADVSAILSRLRQRVGEFMDPDSVVVCATAPAPVVVRDASGTHSEAPSPDTGDLADRIAGTLREQGRTLLAENVLLRAKRVSDKARDAIHAVRARQAAAIVSRFTWATAGVMFVNPVPALGALAAAVINYQMVCEIAKVFGAPVGTDAAKRMARELAQVMVKMGVVGLSAELLGKALKATMVGFVAGGAIEAVAGAYLTKLAGAVFIEYFAHDQDWGEGGMQGAVERKFQLQRRHEFVAEFIKEAAQRVFQREVDG